MAQILLSPSLPPQRGFGGDRSPPFTPIEKEEKPRLERYRALLSKADPNLDYIEDAFLEWSQYPEWLVFMGEHIHTGEKRFKAVKSAKRGNDVYSWKINKRLDVLEALPNTKFFNYRDRSSRHKTRALFITLTFERIQRLDLAWENVGKAYNQFMSRMRRKYGVVHGFRVWEAHKDGYPHIHAVLIFESQEFDAFHYGGVWRVQEKRADIEPMWKYGFSDVEALTGIREGVRYVTKYLTKLHRVIDAQNPISSYAKWRESYLQAHPEKRLSSPGGHQGVSRELNNLHFSASTLTLSLMWIFKRRAFGFSRRLLDLIREMTNSNKSDSGALFQVDFEGLPVWVWRLVGFWGGNLGEKWSRELSLREFRSIKSDSSWSFSMNYR